MSIPKIRTFHPHRRRRFPLNSQQAHRSPKTSSRKHTRKSAHDRNNKTRNAEKRKSGTPVPLRRGVISMPNAPFSKNVPWQAIGNADCKKHGSEDCKTPSSNSEFASTVPLRIKCENEKLPAWHSKFDTATPTTKSRPTRVWSL